MPILYRAELYRSTSEVDSFYKALYSVFSHPTGRPGSIIQYLCVVYSKSHQELYRKVGASQPQSTAVQSPYMSRRIREML
jgi:hypothetical protein